KIENGRIRTKRRKKKVKPPSPGDVVKGREVISVTIDRETNDIDDRRRVYYRIGGAEFSCLLAVWDVISSNEPNIKRGGRGAAAKAAAAAAKAAEAEKKEKEAKEKDAKKAKAN
ncbi:MAG: hypothetical protein AAF514_05705, partial [Verrucomicrobiota bacterium]